ncbi:MAG: hypothetical protein V7K67_23730 [Nostoc sp.]
MSSAVVVCSLSLVVDSQKSEISTSAAPLSSSPAPLSSGITLKAEVYNNTIVHVWFSPIECEFVFIDELEFL